MLLICIVVLDCKTNIFDVGLILALKHTVLGLGISLLYNTVTSYFRLNEHFRLAWYSIGRKSGSEDTIKWERSAPILDAKNFLTKTNDGSIRLIVSPETALTSSLNVSLLTLSPGREIPSTVSTGVEFYYVIDGEGSFSQQGVLETAKLHRGDCFVVLPGRFRWISNNNDNSNKNTQDLVLLRASDCGIDYNRSQRLDVIRMDPAYKKKNTMDRLRDGLQSVQDFAQEYLNSATHER